MTDKPGVKSQGHRQLSMLLPIKGGSPATVSADVLNEELLRQAILHQLEKSGLRKNP